MGRREGGKKGERDKESKMERKKIKEKNEIIILLEANKRL